MRTGWLATCGAVVLGLALASMPYLMYAARAGHGHAAGAHGDHEPHLGGQLAMVGDHHLELVRKGGRIHLYTSDAWRRPVDAVGASVRFDEGEAVAMQRERFSLSSPDLIGAHEVTCDVWLPAGERLESTFVLAATDSPGR